MDAVIRADMAKYDFNHLLTSLHDFCNGDLSAFYFDIRKDSLYCDRPDSDRRRAARTVMNWCSIIWFSGSRPSCALRAKKRGLRAMEIRQKQRAFADLPVVPKRGMMTRIGGKEMGTNP